MVIGVLTLIVPLGRKVADNKTNAPKMVHYDNKPQDFPTTEQYLPLNEYMPDECGFILNLFENKLPRLSDKLETLLEWLKKIVAEHVQVPRYLAEILSSISY